MRVRKREIRSITFLICERYYHLWSLNWKLSTRTTVYRCNWQGVSLFDPHFPRRLHHSYSFNVLFLGRLRLIFPSLNNNDPQHFPFYNITCPTFFLLSAPTASFLWNGMFSLLTHWLWYLQLVKRLQKERCVLVESRFAMQKRCVFKLYFDIWIFFKVFIFT